MAQVSMSVFKRFTNMGKWILIFFDTVSYLACFSDDAKQSARMLPLSAYFMVDTVYDVALMSDAQKLYVHRQVAGMGAGSMLACFAGFLGCFGLFGPDEGAKIRLPGF